MRPSSYGLPVNSPDHEKSLLIVSLMGLHKGGDVMLSQHFRKSLPDNVHIQTWHPSDSLLQSIASKSPRRDCVGTIYAVAILAYRSGWSGLIVADALTSRQLSGTQRVGESPLVSVIMVAVKPSIPLSSPDTSENDEVHVFLERTTGDEGENAALLKALQNLEVSEPYSYDWLYTMGDGIYTEMGLVLNDPDRPVFSADTAKLLGHEELSNAMTKILLQHTPLPAEIVLRTVSYIHDEQLNPMPSWLGIFSLQNLYFVVLFPTTAEELSTMHSTIQKAVSFLLETKSRYRYEMNVRLIPWELHRVASRRDLLRTYREYRQRQPGHNMHFIPGPFKYDDDDDVYFTKFGIIRFEIQELAIVSWATLGEILEYTYGRPECPNFEMIYPFDRPFHVDLPLWLSADSEDDSIPVFYLTNKLTDEQDKAIRDEMDRGDDDHIKEQVFCFVSWKSGKEGLVDGTLEDMWELMWKAYTFPAHSCSEIFFIDGQSGIDQTLIMAQPEFYRGEDDKGLLNDTREPYIMGFCYGRVRGASVRNAYTRLNSAEDVGIDDLATDLNVFPRPGWPGNGIYKNPDSELE